MVPRWFQVAAASWERAESAVYTKGSRVQITGKEADGLLNSTPGL